MLKKVKFGLYNRIIKSISSNQQNIQKNLKTENAISIGLVAFFAYNVEKTYWNIEVNIVK